MHYTCRLSYLHNPKGPFLSALNSWWCHQMETFSVLLAICAGNSPVSGEFPAQRPVTRGFDVFFDLCPDKRLSKQPWGWWFETPSHSLWRHRNAAYPFKTPICNSKLKVWKDQPIIHQFHGWKEHSAGTLRNNHVITTSKRRRDVVLT